MSLDLINCEKCGRAFMTTTKHNAADAPKDMMKKKTVLVLMPTA